MVECRVVTNLGDPTIGVRASVRGDEMQTFFKESYARLFEVIGDYHLEVTGEPFGRYRGAPGEVMDIEAGVPVAKHPRDGHVDGVVRGRLLSADCVEAIHIGSYDTLTDTYASMVLWMHARGLNPLDDMWEFYLTDPNLEPDPSKWRTKVVWPFS